MDSKTTNNAGIAAVLSFIYNGLGQIYNGEIKKGLAIMTGSSACLIIIIVGAIFSAHWLMTQAFSIVELILGLLAFVIGVCGACAIGYYSINDAYQKAANK